VHTPDVEFCVLNIPPGKKAQFWEKYNKIPAESKRSWVRHIVKKGETLSDIAKKYGTTLEILKTYNKLNSTRIRVNQDIVLPVPKNKNYLRWPVQFPAVPERKKRGRQSI
jgi:LysM repeat protein